MAYRLIGKSRRIRWWRESKVWWRCEATGSDRRGLHQSRSNYLESHWIVKSIRRTEWWWTRSSLDTYRLGKLLEIIATGLRVHRHLRISLYRNRVASRCDIYQWPDRRGERDASPANSNSFQLSWRHQWWRWFSVRWKLRFISVAFRWYSQIASSPWTKWLYFTIILIIRTNRWRARANLALLRIVDTRWDRYAPRHHTQA